MPTTAPVVEILLGGKARKLYYGFRAWHLLGVNPLRTAEVQAFLADLDIEKAAKWVWAGLCAHEALVRRLAFEDHQEPPPAEEWDLDRVIDLLDAGAFGEILEAIKKASEGAEPEDGARPQ